MGFFSIQTKDGPFTGFVLIDDSRRLLITVNGKPMRLLWSDRWGPSLGDRHGDPADNQPGPKHAFWRAASLWARQGKRTTGCEAIWHDPAPEIIEVRGRRIVRVIQEAEDPDYSEIIVRRPK